jgi:hypothetical protein
LASVLVLAQQAQGLLVPSQAPLVPVLLVQQAQCLVAVV